MSINPHTIIKVINAARPYISNTGYEGDNGYYDGKTIYVCVAISIARNNEEITIEEEKKVQAYIKFLLGNNATVFEWLEVNGINIWGTSSETKQQYRHMWVDHMIDMATKSITI